MRGLRRGDTSDLKIINSFSKCASLSYRKIEKLFKSCRISLRPKISNIKYEGVGGDIVYCD